MKKIAVIMVLFLGISSCTLDKASSFESASTINGTWIWEKSVGSITGNSVETPTSTGIERKLVFTNDGKVMVYATGQETRSVAYEIKQGKTIFDDLDHNLLVFDGMTYVISHIDASSLILDDNFPDGYRFHYKR